MDADKEADILGKNLLTIRKRNQLTQIEMARILGIGIRSLRNLEHGILPQHLTCDFLFAVYSQFGIRPSSLLGEDCFPE